MNELNIYQLIGEIIENCQCIEHDLKIIYAIAKPGDFNYNLEDTKKWNLGEIIAKIEELDHKNIFPFDLDDKDYELLNSIRNERNFVCHECFQSYEYIEDYHFKRVEYEKVVNRVANFHKISKRLSQAIGTIRVAIDKEYRGYN